MVDVLRIYLIMTTYDEALHGHMKRVLPQEYAPKGDVRCLRSKVTSSSSGYQFPIGRLIAYQLLNYLDYDQTEDIQICARLNLPKCFILPVVHLPIMEVDSSNYNLTLLALSHLASITPL